MGAMQTIETVFEKTAGSGQIHEAVLLVENKEGEYSVCCSHGGRSANSPMNMASTAKLFTTACTLILCERGSLSLTDKIAEYFSDDVLRGLHVYKSREYSSKLTIADLLFQISGLPDYFEEGRSLKAQAIQGDYCVTFSQMLDMTKQLRPHFAPRSSNKAFYADINFDILGEIIEKATQLKLETVYETLLFRPLGMQNTYLPISGEAFIPDIYYKNKPIQRPQAIMSFRASGGCITTARDLMLFMKAFFGGALFSRESLQTISVYRSLQFSMGPIRYGGGHMQIPLKSVNTLFRGEGELLGHSGSTGSFAFYYPHKDVYFVGDLNQMANPSLPIMLVMRLAMSIA